MFLGGWWISNPNLEVFCLPHKLLNQAPFFNSLRNGESYLSCFMSPLELLQTFFFLTQKKTSCCTTSKIWNYHLQHHVKMESKNICLLRQPYNDTPTRTSGAGPPPWPWQVSFPATALPTNSPHQDYYIYRTGFPKNLHLPLILGKGANPKITVDPLVNRINSPTSPQS